MWAEKKMWGDEEKKTKWWRRHDAEKIWGGK